MEEITGEKEPEGCAKRPPQRRMVMASGKAVGKVITGRKRVIRSCGRSQEGSANRQDASANAFNPTVKYGGAWWYNCTLASC